MKLQNPISKFQVVCGSFPDKRLDRMLETHLGRHRAVFQRSMQLLFVVAVILPCSSPLVGNYLAFCHALLIIADVCAESFITTLYHFEYNF
jgi:hypothetical protein